MTLFDLAKIRGELERQNREMAEPGFWDDPSKAQKAMKQKKSFENTLASFEELEKGFDDVIELIDMASELEDEEAVPTILETFHDLDMKRERLRLSTLLTGK